MKGKEFLIGACEQIIGGLEVMVEVFDGTVTFAGEFEGDVGDNGDGDSGLARGDGALEFTFVIFEWGNLGDTFSFHEWSRFFRCNLE